MKKVLPILCGLIAVMLLAFPTQASNLNNNVNQQSFNAIQSGSLLLGGGQLDLDTQTVNRILYMASHQLSMSFSDLIDLYYRGEVTIEQVDHNTFHVYCGEPNIAIVVLDLL